MTLSIQRQVLFRSQHLQAILGLLSYNQTTPDNNKQQQQQQLITKKPEPNISQNNLYSVAIGSIIGDSVSGGGGVGDDMREEERSVATGSSFGSHNNEGDHIAANYQYNTYIIIHTQYIYTHTAS